MAGLIIPLGLDIKGFEKSLSDASKTISRTQKFLEKGGTIKVVNDKASDAAEKSTKKMLGTTSKLKDEMKAVETTIGAINLSTKKGQNEFVKGVNTWGEMRKQMGDSYVSLEKIYTLQQRYTQLTGQKFTIKTFDDIKKLQEQVALQERLAAQKKKDEARAASDERARQRRQAESDEMRIRAAERATRAAEKEALLKKQTRHADRVTRDAMAMEGRTADELRARIEALSKAKAKLKLDNEAGRKKFAEVERQIARNRRQVEELTKKKKSLTDTTDSLKRALIGAFSIQAVTGFVKNIITIGGELEKQKVALSIIVDDISRANIIFSQLKSQALESPFRFKELVDSTRKLSAYNIEAEKFYETQSMLSELSAGLGVDIDRLILAYGQVRAATVLRGQEMRQFTEAGIPVIDALAKKFGELEGRMVSTSEVFERVSDRAVPFRMIEEVFRDMTEEGGKFYNMQIEQSKTLAGQYSNLGDAIDIMFLDISKEQGGLLKGMIGAARLMISNWQDIGYGIGAVAVATAAYYTVSILSAKGYITLNARYTSMLVAQEVILKRLRILKMGFYAAAVFGLVALIAHWYRASQEIDRYKEKLEGIGQENIEGYRNEVRSLNRLKNQLSETVQGSIEYKDIRDKIISQYGQYYPNMLNETSTLLDITNGYDAATEAIKRHYAIKAMEENYATLQEDELIKKSKQKGEGEFKQYLVDVYRLSDYEAKVAARQYTERLEDALMQGRDTKRLFQDIKKISDDMGLGLEGKKFFNKNTEFQISDMYGNFVETAKEKLKIIKQVNESTFGDLSERVRQYMVDANAAIDANYNEKRNKAVTKLEQSIIGDEAARKKKITEAITKVAIDVENELKKKGKKLNTKSLFDVLLTGGDTGNYPSILSEKNIALLEGVKKGTSVQDGITQIFRKLSDEYNKEISGIKKSDTALKNNIELRAEAADAIRATVVNYTTLTDLYEKIPEEKDAIELQIKRKGRYIEKLKQQAAAYDTSKRNYFEYKQLLSTVKIEEEELTKTLEKKSILMRIIDFFGIKSKKEEKPSTENPEIERARRLVNIYKELNSAYDKYIEYTDSEYAARQSINELTDEYNELNKEMGNKLPEITAVTTVSELVALLEKAKRFFNTSKGKGILTTALVGTKGAQNIEEVKDTFEKTKDEIDALFKLVRDGADNSNIYNQIAELVKKINVKSKKGEEFVLELNAKIKESTIKDQITAISKELSTADQQREFGGQLESLFVETGVDLSGVFKNNILTYEQYIRKLNEIRDKYQKMGADGAEKVNELDIKIAEKKTESILYYATEAAKIQFQLADEQKKRAIIQEQISKENAKIVTLQEQLKTEGLADEVKQRMTIELNYYNWHVQLLAKQEDELNDSMYRSSKLYQDLFGDIEQYGQETYKAMLLRIRELITSGDLQKDGKGKFKLNYNGEEVILNAKDIGDAKAKVDKLLREIAESKNFGEIKETFKKLIGADGTFNFSVLGKGIGLIADEIQKLEPLADLFGMSEQGKTYLTSSVSAFQSIGRIIANPADIGAWVELIKSYVLIMDADNIATINRYEEAIKKLEEKSSELNESLNKTVGTDEYNDNIKESIRLFDEMAYKYEMMAKEEKEKKASDEEAYESFLDKAEEARKKKQDQIDSTIAEWGSTIEDAASTFANSWVDAFLTAGDGLKSFDDSFGAMMKNIATKQIAAKYFEKILEPMMKQIDNAVDPTNKNGSGVIITDDELQAIFASGNLSREMYEKLRPFMESLMASFGVGSGSTGSMDSLQKGIQNITESTAEIIASYMNSVRLEVITIRRILETKMGSGTNQSDTLTSIRDIMAEYYPQYLSNLIAIKDNTAYLKDAYDPTARGFRIK